MTDSALTPPADTGWHGLVALVLDSVSAAASRRAYQTALERFHRWYCSEMRPPFSKAVVQQYKTWLQARGYAASTTAVHIAAVRKLALEAADNGLMDPALAAGIARVRAPRRHGRRTGNWLSAADAERLIRAPGTGSPKGLRDTALLAMAITCGLRRSELAGLRLEQIQLREARWVIVDLRGKNDRIRTVPLPLWVKLRLDQWLHSSGITGGPVFRAISRRGRVAGRALSAQAVYEIATGCGLDIGLIVAPHDLRRTFARLARAASAPIEQIQYSLGHASLLTTERYLGLKQDLVNAPGDLIDLQLQTSDPNPSRHTTLTAGTSEKAHRSTAEPVGPADAKYGADSVSAR